MQRIAKLVTLLLALSLISAPAFSATVGTKVIRGAAIGFAVTKVAKPLDSFINTITLRHGMKTGMATKVVPVLSVGEKGYIGGTQVSGPKYLVDKVQAVFQYEKNFSNNNYRAKILLPSGSLNPLKLSRVPKVGVSATIDVALDGRQRYSTVGTGIDGGDILRGAGVLVAVKNFGKTINSGLNTITFNKGAVTKVVPLGTVGEKTYLGGAQISGSSVTANKVNAVWQYEDLFSGGVYRVKIFVPTTSSNPLKMKRVDGAGVVAIVDMALSQQKDVTTKQPSRWYQYGGQLGSRVKYAPVPAHHDNGLHRGWYKDKDKGKYKIKKNAWVDEKWRERLRDMEVRKHRDSEDRDD